MGAATPVRRVEVDPERLGKWVDGFAQRHGLYTVDSDLREVRLHAADGAEAALEVPFPPLDSKASPGIDALAEHAGRSRTVGVILTRLGGYAAGVFDGTRLIASKVGSRPVHGRNKAGGQSQQRFARRREKQAAEALAAAADVTARVLLPHADALDAVVLGGDRRAIDRLRDDVRLAPLFDLATDRFLSVPDPKFAVLSATPRRFRAVTIRLADP